VPDENASLLIVEDDLDIAEMLNAYFRVQGYKVRTASWGEEALRSVQRSHPDLVILDIRLPDIDGFEVARRLRTNRRTQDIPILFLTEKREREDRLKGLELKAEDYITKPFDIQELRLRVRNALRRNTQGTLTNTITGLPEGNLVDERLRECLVDQNWAALLVALDNLDRFREVYGFVASDDLLRAAALMLHDILGEVGSPTDFLGHLSPGEFLVVTSPETLQALKENIVKRLEASLDYFYRDQDRASEAFRDRQLAIRTAELLADQKPFSDLNQLKAELNNLIRGA
jgi:PleD family two-component response regulator